MLERLGICLYYMCEVEKKLQFIVVPFRYFELHYLLPRLTNLRRVVWPSWIRSLIQKEF